MEKDNLTANQTKTEYYEIPRPPPPKPPEPSLDTLLQHKNDEVIWSEFDYLINYNPTKMKNNHPDWHKCKLLGSLLGTEEDIDVGKFLS